MFTVAIFACTGSFLLVTEQFSEQPPKGPTGQLVDLVVSSDAFY